MAELKFFYPNCDCCSGSGSSGSGSGSVPCGCSFIPNVAGCPDTHCPTEFVATIRLNFSGCGSSPIGSCASGSTGATGGGPTTGGDFDPTGSGSSGSSCRVCPDCCSIANKVWQMTLRCVGDYLASDSLIYGLGSECFGSNAFDGQTGSDTCLGFRSDRCSAGNVYKGLGGGISSSFNLPLDGSHLLVNSDYMTVSSCNPFLLSGTVSNVFPLMNVSQFDYEAVFPCFSSCLPRSFIGSSNNAPCVTGTVTVTEATP